MDADLERLVAEAIPRLTGPRPRAAATAITYKADLDSWWNPYARRRGLPTVFTATTEPVTATQILGLLTECADGTIRRGTKDGNRERAGTALAPTTVDGLLAALRAAHVDAGLPWAGADQRVRDAVAGYHKLHGRSRTKAAPMTVDQVCSIFARCPSVEYGPGADLAAARAVAVALSVPFLTVARLKPSVVAWTPDHVTIETPVGPHAARCLAPALADPIVRLACGHCILGAWLASPAAPLLLERRVPHAQASARRLSAALPQASYDAAVLSAGDLWSTIALGLPSTATTWLSMRAAVLPMRAVGLRFDDIQNLEPADVRLNDGTVTLSINGKTERPERPHIVTLVATGGPMCPVQAILSYESWVRAFLPQRRRWMLAQRGRTAVRVPTDIGYPPGSRALYQSLRLWLAEQGATLDGREVDTRPALTPHSARRGFAQQAEAEGFRELEIQRAMRHTKPETTQGYLKKDSDSQPATEVLHRLADAELKAMPTTPTEASKR